MTFDPETIREIYSSKVARKYDFSMPPFFGKWKKSAFNDSSLKRGDNVLVFCCGTGLDFPHILSKIGKEGSIVGVDFSAIMLEKAKGRIIENSWYNIELIEADIVDFKDELERKFDVGVCTLGLSIIPEFRSAYYNLLSAIKTRGEVIIGDMQLASGRHARFNPLTIFLAKKFGGTYAGHKNSLELRSMMERELTDIRSREFFFRSYYYCTGKTK